MDFRTLIHSSNLTIFITLFKINIEFEPNLTDPINHTIPLGTKISLSFVVNGKFDRQIIHNIDLRKYGNTLLKIIVIILQSRY